ncbi:glycosyltransferase family 2 protein [Thermoanaerobacterium thermosaccharolyticum]|uniref:glycosyltransferase family 2 protein n=1 Tax=Thermoanaerobacterium thermosaccharolyticum TaxID=1517 RepID=UPI003DA9A23E
MIEPLVYIILINYNGYKDTIECVRSIEKITYKNYKIVIIDNASTDNSIDILRQTLKNYKIIQNDKNLGFAGGNNVGIRYALENGAEYILLLNNDTVVDKDFLSYLIKGFSVKENVGMVGGKIYYYDKPDKIWYAGGKFNKLRARGVHFTLDNNIDYKEVKFITGCLQLISADAIKKVGLMKEGYFLYYEDVDYCFRFIKKGYKLIYSRNSIIYHKCGGSANYKSPLSIYYSNRSRFLFINENLDGILLIISNIIFFLEFFIKFIIYKKDNKKSLLKVYNYIKNWRT